MRFLATVALFLSVGLAAAQVQQIPDGQVQNPKVQPPAPKTPTMPPTYGPPKSVNGSHPVPPAPEAHPTPAPSAKTMYSATSAPVPASTGTYGKGGSSSSSTPALTTNAGNVLAINAMVLAAAAVCGVLAL